MLLVAAILSLAIGVVLGMLGGGGAILTVPMLVYAVGLEPKAAIATSLFVGSTSVVGTVLNARARTVQWRIGLAFGAAAMTGAFVGGRLRGRAEPAPSPKGPALALGVSVGALSGLVGAGGGSSVTRARPSQSK